MVRSDAIMATERPTLKRDLAEQHDALDHWCNRVMGMDLKTAKLIKNVSLSVLFLGFATFLVLKGSDPTLTFTGTLLLVALLNGIEMGEFYAALAELQQIRAEQPQDSEDSDR